MSNSRRKLEKSLQRLSRNLRRHRLQILRSRKIVAASKSAPRNVSSTPLKISEADSTALTSNDSTGQGLLSMPLPDVSPFLQEAEKAKQMGNAKRGRKTKVVTVAYLTPARPTPLCRAGQSQIFQDEVETSSDEKFARLAAAALYARYHYVDSSTLARFVIPKRLRQSEPAKKALLDRITDDCDRYQTRIMSFYHAGVKALVDQMGGMGAWKAEERNTRLKIFERVFGMRPLDTAMGALGPVAFAVPLMDIFSDTSANHRKWQDFHREVFVQVCEDVFTLRLASPIDAKRECFSNWRSLIASAAFTKLDLGGMNDIPVTWGSLVSRRVRHPRITSEGGSL